MADNKAWQTMKPFVNGGLSGIGATCVIQPLDIVKVRQRPASTHGGCFPAHCAADAASCLQPRCEPLAAPRALGCQPGGRRRRAGRADGAAPGSSAGSLLRGPLRASQRARRAQLPPCEPAAARRPQRRLAAPPAAPARCEPLTASRCRPDVPAARASLAPGAPAAGRRRLAVRHRQGDHRQGGLPQALYRPVRRRAAPDHLHLLPPRHLQVRAPPCAHASSHERRMRRVQPGAWRCGDAGAKSISGRL